MDELFCFPFKIFEIWCWADSEHKTIRFEKIFSHFCLEKYFFLKIISENNMS